MKSNVSTKRDSDNGLRTRNKRCHITSTCYEIKSLNKNPAVTNYVIRSKDSKMTKFAVTPSVLAICKMRILGGRFNQNIHFVSAYAWRRFHSAVDGFKQSQFCHLTTFKQKINSATLFKSDLNSARDLS